MNYAARCLGVVHEPGIYITENALRKRREQLAVVPTGDREVLFIADRTQIHVKGITKHVAFHKITTDRDTSETQATIDHYATKALVRAVIPKGFFSDEAGAPSSTEETKEGLDETSGQGKKRPLDSWFEEKVKPLFKGDNRDQGQLNISPHLFLAFTISLKQGEDFLFFRVEGETQAYLERTIVETNEHTLSAKRASSPTPPDTRTHFIRNSLPSERDVGERSPVDKRETGNSQEGRLGRWTRRDERSPLGYFYAEFKVRYFDDIDSIVENIIRNADQPKTRGPESRNKPDQFGLVEIQRLWGEPAIYALLKRELRSESDNESDLRKSLKKQLARWSATTRRLKCSPRIEVHYCRNFAVVERDSVRLQ
jgi:hypothetical protein